MHLCAMFNCHIFAVRTIMATPNTSVFYCQHLSAFGDRTPKCGISEYIFVRTRTPVLFLERKVKAIASSGEGPTSLFLTEKRSPRRNEGTLTVTSSTCASRLIHGLLMTNAVDRCYLSHAFPCTKEFIQVLCPC
ncbi:hypothetical protein V8E52_011298 [Russula decolorans]